ncbi:MAG: insulinase family protein [Polyangiaceae bacterium]|nr:insulinase family protein [Polyangiaceae bacterium]
MSTYGFELVTEHTIREIKSKVILYRHRKTATELLSVVNDDENKVFGITFRTPPKDSTGVAHILEHSVLCGSRKYPVKEPFVELIKSSLKTFLNAFTYPDKTCYPVASQNTQDFYNLVGVYLDAVFFPRLTPEVLMQEGWHLEIATATDDSQPDAETPNDNSKLCFQGVVFGEMKGVYSSPDSVLAEVAQHSVFPDNTYGLDSGGNPKHIPDLTFEAFKAFHEEYYHPSNARVFFWGDDDPDERLRIVDEYLSQFEHRKVDSSIALQSKFSAPRVIVKPYAASDSRDSDSAMVHITWLLPEVVDAGVKLEFQLMSQILVGTPACPLYKALIDSGIGEDLTYAGVETDLRQMVFGVGLKGIDPNLAEEVEQLVMGVLESIEKEGIPHDLLEASLNTMEFALREANSGSYPKGLIYMLTSLRSWLYDCDPIAPLAFEKRLAALKNKVLGDGAFIGNMIREHLLDNPHRTRVLLVPDTEEGARQEKAEQDRLAERRALLSDDGIREVIEQARCLKERQQAPDSPEALATIPTLSVADLPRLSMRIPETQLSLLNRDSALYFHDLNTFGIVYFDLAFDLSVVPQEDFPLLSVFSKALTMTGTDKLDFVSMSRQIGAKTGGIGASYLCIPRESGDVGLWFLVRGKAMVDKGHDLTTIMRELLLGARLDDRERIRQLLLEEKAETEAGLVPSGSSFVDARIAAAYSDGGWFDEQTGGISYLFFLRDLIAGFDDQWPNLHRRLEQMRRRLFNRSNAIANVTVDEAGFRQFSSAIDDMIGGLPDQSFDRLRWGRTAEPCDARNEGLVVPAQVNYVGKGGNIRDVGYAYHGSSMVITKWLKTSWLWDRVRVQGGAYGAYCGTERLTGLFNFGSYRDPNLEQTLRVYDETSDYLANVSLSSEEIDKGILGVIGNLDTYRLPDAKGSVAFMRRLAGITEETRARIRAEVFDTTLENFREFGRCLALIKDKSTVVVLGGRDSLQKVAEPLGLRLTPVL